MEILTVLGYIAAGCYGVCQLIDAVQGNNIEERVVYLFSLFISTVAFIILSVAFWAEMPNTLFIFGCTVQCIFWAIYIGGLASSNATRMPAPIAFRRQHASREEEILGPNKSFVWRRKQRF